MKKLLIVVDYQKDFVTGSLGFPEAEALEGAISKKIQSYEAEGNDVVFTMDTHDSGYMRTNEGKHLPIAHCIKGTEGWELYGSIKQKYNQKFLSFTKSTFGSYELGQYIHNKNYGEIELVGLISNICVLSNAVIAKAALPAAQIFVDAACIASNDKEMNEKALSIMEGLHIIILNKEKV